MNESLTHEAKQALTRRLEVATELGERTATNKQVRQDIKEHGKKFARYVRGMMDDLEEAFKERGLDAILDISFPEHRNRYVYSIPGNCSTVRFSFKGTPFDILILQTLTRTGPIMRHLTLMRMVADMFANLVDPTRVRPQDPIRNFSKEENEFFMSDSAPLCIQNVRGMVEIAFKIFQDGGLLDHASRKQNLSTRAVKGQIVDVLKAYDLRTEVTLQVFKEYADKMKAEHARMVALCESQAGTITSLMESNREMKLSVRELLGALAVRQSAEKPWNVQVDPATTAMTFREANDIPACAMVDAPAPNPDGFDENYPVNGNPAAGGLVLNRDPFFQPAPGAPAA